MNDTDLLKLTLDALLEVLFDDARDISRRERVQVDMVFDGENDGLGEGGVRNEGQWICRTVVSGEETFEEPDQRR